MCFSATASFVSSAVLIGVGAISLNKTKNKKQFMFAGIPLMFGIQQISEGVLWLSLTHPYPPSWHNTATNIFLFFAQMFWCTWVPFSFLLIEKEPARKKILRFVAILGVLASCLLGYRLLYHHVPVQILGHHIHYEIESPKVFVIINSLLYIISTVIPCFISSVAKTKTLGILLVLSVIVSRVFYEAYFISVWCFLAALLSTVILVIMNDLQKDSNEELNYSNQHSIN